MRPCKKQSKNKINHQKNKNKLYKNNKEIIKTLNLNKIFTQIKTNNYLKKNNVLKIIQINID